MMIEKLNYRTITIGSPKDAVSLARAHRHDIRLLITDVVMPGMNGNELFEKLRRDIPGLKCLFMSGYTADVIASHGVLDNDIQFVEKPMRIKELSLAIQAALHSSG